MRLLKVLKKWTLLEEHKNMTKLLKNIIIITLKIYKVTISGFFDSVLGRGCKYQKTCSEFAIEAIEEKGIMKGITFSTRRFLSCQPFSDKYYLNVKDIS